MQNSPRQSAGFVPPISKPIQRVLRLIDLDHGKIFPTFVVSSTVASLSLSRCNKVRPRGSHLHIIMNSTFSVGNHHRKSSFFNTRIIILNTIFIILNNNHVSVDSSQAVPRIANDHPFINFSTENHHFSGATRHYLCNSSRKFKNELAFRLQFVTGDVHA